MFQNNNTFTFDTGIYGFFYKILRPVEWLMTYIMFYCHKFLTLIGFPDGPGLAWALSVVLLVLVVNLCVLPLFIKQLKSMQRMQAIQPKLTKIQNKYRNKRDPASVEAMRRETQKLYAENKANPMSSCLPMLVQGPVFMTMFYVLSAVPFIARGIRKPLGAFNKTVAKEFEETTFFGLKISDNFTTAQGAGRIVIVVFIILMCLAMFYSQFHNVRKNMPRSAMQGQQYKMQQIMAFVFPVMYIFSGIYFPFAVLIYWLTNNLWNLGRTLFQVRHMPTPDSPAAEEKTKRDYRRENERRKHQGLPSIEEEALMEAKRIEEEAKKNKGVSHQRNQPRRKRKGH